MLTHSSPDDRAYGFISPLLTNNTHTMHPAGQRDHQTSKGLVRLLHAALFRSCEFMWWGLHS